MLNLIILNFSARITEIPSISSAEISELESLDKQITLAMESVDQELQLSSYVWICTSTHSASTVTVIDAKNPAEVLDSFPVCQTHLLCICTVIGALEKDYVQLENSEVSRAGETLDNPGDADEIGRVEFVRFLEADSPSKKRGEVSEVEKEIDVEDASEAEAINTDAGSSNGEFTAVVEDIFVPPISPFRIHEPKSSTQPASTKTPALPFPNPVNPISGSDNPLEEPPMSSVGPTMWLGAQNGMLYVHSSVARWRACLHKVMLPDAVLSIVHVDSRVVVALANGKLAIFRRQISGEWDLNNYHLLTIGIMATISYLM